MEEDAEIVAAAATVLMLTCGLLLKSKKTKITKKRRKRRWWMVSINQSRLRYNGSDLLGDLRKERSGKFENFCRMSPEDFDYLLSKIRQQIIKKDTILRKAISAEERFAVTLRFLATGDSFQSLGYLFKISPQLISEIVPEVCNALISSLKDEIKLPKNSHEWLTIAKEFEEQWNFPHCLGALDGKHIVMQSPFNSGSEYYNYKNSFSVVLMAAVDANYCFTYAEVGCQGRISDGGVFKNTVFYDKMEREQLAIPLDVPLIGQERTPLPFLFLADEAFPLRRNIMKPYAGVHCKGSSERIFNYRLSRARRIVENAFGILAAVFRVFRKPMLLQPEKVSVITMTCVLLHNFLRRSKTSSIRYTPQGAFDVEIEGEIIPGLWREDQTETSFLPLAKIARKPPIEAKKIRDEFAVYFKTTGKVPWQEKYC